MEKLYKVIFTVSLSLVFIVGAGIYNYSSNNSPIIWEKIKN